MAVCNGCTLLMLSIELSTCLLYPYDVSMSREWSVDASGGHGNNPRERPNHGAAKHGLGVNLSVTGSRSARVSFQCRFDPILYACHFNSTLGNLTQVSRVDSEVCSTDTALGGGWVTSRRQVGRGSRRFFLVGRGFRRISY